MDGKDFKTMKDHDLLITIAEKVYSIEHRLDVLCPKHEDMINQLQLDVQTMKTRWQIFTGIVGAIFGAMAAAIAQLFGRG